MSNQSATAALRGLLRRMHIVTVLATIAVAGWPAATVHAEAPDKSVIGQWKLTEVLDSSEITALDDEHAQELVGKVLTIGQYKIQLGDRICKAPDFEVTRAETNDYFARGAHASAARLGLPNPVTAVHIDCTYVYKKAPDRMVVHWKGFFFDAIRQK